MGLRFTTEGPLLPLPLCVPVHCPAEALSLVDMPRCPLENEVRSWRAPSLLECAHQVALGYSLESWVGAGLLFLWDRLREKGNFHIISETPLGPRWSPWTLSHLVSSLYASSPWVSEKQCLLNFNLPLLLTYLSVSLVKGHSWLFRKDS